MVHLPYPARGWRFRLVLGLVLWVGVTMVTPNARAERTSDAEAIARLDRQLRELKVLLADVQRNEREHFEAIRRMFERVGANAPLGAHAASDAPAGVDAAGEGAALGVPAVEAKTTLLATPVALATVTGSVTTKGRPLRDVYIYLEGFRSNAGRKAEIEVMQTHKTFEPAFSVALVGTRVTFPNRDTFFHNVFSTTPVPFDLGTYRADETPPTVTLKNPGVVELSCNIHAQMRAQILVVPNRVFTRVADDGTFRLDKVPAGRRKLVAWGPGLRPVRVEVNVAPKGTIATFDLEPEVPTRRLNKFGLPYGAYKE